MHAYTRSPKKAGRSATKAKNAIELLLIEQEGATGNTNIKQCLRKVADGHFTAAVKVLSSSGVAPYCDDIIKALEAKHPYKPPSSMPSITFSEPPLVAEIDSVFSCIKSFPKSTSCGRDGLRA
ncbi:hypothetical protein Tco_0491598 [Tanacetum coccineum]